MHPARAGHMTTDHVHRESGPLHASRPRCETVTSDRACNALVPLAGSDTTRLAIHPAASLYLLQVDSSHREAVEVHLERAHYA